MITIPNNIERIGFFSDLHGHDLNLIEMINTNPEIKYWFSCGDNIELFGESWNNIPTVRLLKKHNILSILGNHEVDFLNNNSLMKIYSKEPEYINFISTLPFSLNISFSDFTITLIHSTPKGTHDYLNPDASEVVFQSTFDSVSSSFIFVGHTHKQFIKHLNSKSVVNPGALQDNEREYCLFDKDGCIQFKKLPE